MFQQCFLATHKAALMLVDIMLTSKACKFISIYGQASACQVEAREVVKHLLNRREILPRNQVTRTMAKLGTSCRVHIESLDFNDVAK